MCEGPKHRPLPDGIVGNPEIDPLGCDWRPIADSTHDLIVSEIGLISSAIYLNTSSFGVTVTKDNTMIGTLIGAILATFGFLIMRNPMRLAVLAPGARGYYQRMVLDTSTRNQLRIVGVLACIFGLCIGTAASGAFLKYRPLQSISAGLLILLWVVFLSAWVAGLILGVIHLVQGRGFSEWLQMWRKGAVLGEVNVYPPITPKMQREAILFTIILGALLCITIIAALVLRR